MQGHDIVVIGFSAGGIEPLLELVADLPSDLPAAVFVVHHFPAHSVSALPAIVARVSELPVRTATDREPVTSGRIYVGRPDCHLLLMPGIMRLTRGPREHGNRPSLDPLFRSAARSYASRVIGVILSGTLDDGTVGLHAIKAAGGITVVQDPEEAAYPGMPKSALDHVEVDHVATAGELGVLLSRLTREPALPPAVVSGDVHQDLDPDQPEPAVVGTASLRTATLPGIPSTLTCPECGGLLFEEEKAGLLHFRCHVGHAFSEETLMAVQSQALEGALWAAVRALEEKAELGRRLAERAQAHGWNKSAARFAHAARDAEQGSSVIRDSLLHGPVRQALETPAEEEHSRAGQPGPAPRSGALGR